MPCPSTKFHLSNADLLLAAENEISEQRAERLQAHLAGCEYCRARQAQLQDALQELTQRIRAPLLASPREARIALERKLDELREIQDIATGMLIR